MTSARRSKLELIGLICHLVDELWGGTLMAPTTHLPSPQMKRGHSIRCVRVDFLI
jgi:hypothetical protein